VLHSTPSRYTVIRSRLYHVHPDRRRELSGAHGLQ
jgi:hypothetical protein